VAVGALWVVLVLTVISGIDYFRRFFFEGSRNEKSPAEGRAPEAGSSARA